MRNLRRYICGHKFAGGNPMDGTTICSVVCVEKLDLSPEITVMTIGPIDFHLSLSTLQLSYVTCSRQIGAEYYGIAARCYAASFSNDTFEHINLGCLRTNGVCGRYDFSDIDNRWHKIYNF